MDAACGSACERVHVVLGAEHERVARELAGSRAESVVNERWHEGLSSSIALGVAAAADASPDGFLLLVADQPNVSSALLDRVLSAWDGTATGVAACRYAGTAGVPAVFGRAHREALTSLSGDRGARDLLARAALVDWEEGAVDVDTPEDAASLP